MSTILDSGKPWDQVSAKEVRRLPQGQLNLACSFKYTCVYTLLVSQLVKYLPFDSEFYFSRSL